MRYGFKNFVLVFAGLALVAWIGFSVNAESKPLVTPEPEAGFDEPGLSAMEPSEEERYLAELESWTRPEGPPKVALQAGHWLAREVPDELANLRTNGAKSRGLAEWEVNLQIARKAAMLIGAHGVEVEILPTTVPADYYADAFVAIHADESTDPEVSGYKGASPRRDMTGRAESLAELLDAGYRNATGMQRDPNVTDDMSDYYAFNWRRYEHSLHPMTPAAIFEVGFLTSPDDRRFIVDNQSAPAEGIANAILEFLEEGGLVEAQELNQ